MREKTSISADARGYTLPELAIAMAISVMVIGALLFSAIAIQRSIASTNQYVAGVNDGSRLLDYVAQDLRRALRVGMLVGGATTTFKNNASLTVNETNTLTINIPDYYASNAPDPQPNSPFRTSRYDRGDLNLLSTFNGNGATALNGVIYYNTAITKVGSVETIRFAPASVGMGEIQIRYYRGSRSAGDKTTCFFRGEYAVGSSTSLFPDREIAERVVTDGSTTSLVISAPNLAVKNANYGKTFQITSSFTPKFRRGVAAGPQNDQTITILLRNARRD